MIFLFAVLTLLFNHAAALTHEEGKQLIGVCASSAQIAGSCVCPYLIVSGGGGGGAPPRKRRLFLQWLAVSKRCIDFLPILPVAFTW